MILYNSMSSNKKIIIGLVGLIAGGKGTAAKYLEKKYGAATYRFSTIIRGVLDILHLPHSRETMQKMSTLLRQNFSEDIFARVIADNVKKDGRNIIAVDGIRRFADIKYLNDVEGFVLTRITAEPRVRYERLIGRAENAGDTRKTYEEFLADHEKEAEVEIPHVMKTAAEEIDNNGNLDNLYKQIDLLITKAKKK